MLKYIVSAVTQGFKFKYLLWLSLLGLFIIGLILWLFSLLSDWVTTLITFDWQYSDTLISALTYLLGGIFLFYLGKYLILILMSPVLSLISESIERKHTVGIHSNGVYKGLSIAYSVGRSIRINSRNLLKESFLSIVLFFLGLIPGLAVITIPLLLLVQFYFLGFGMMDFTLERHNAFKETVGWVYQHKWAAIVCGGCLFLFMLIPVLGVILGPYICVVTKSNYVLDNLVKENLA